MATGFTQILSKVEKSVDDLSSVMDTFFKEVDYEALSTEDKIRYDLFLAYALNCSMWMNLRMNGEDPSKSAIRTELVKIKEFMSELQNAIDKKKYMPKLDQNAAKRFIKHGLGPVTNDDNNSKNKHIRFE